MPLYTLRCAFGVGSWRDMITSWRGVCSRGACDLARKFPAYGWDAWVGRSPRAGIVGTGGRRLLNRPRVLPMWPCCSGVEVDFPYDAYPCQLQYMTKVIDALKQVRPSVAHPFGQYVCSLWRRQMRRTISAHHLWCMHICFSCMQGQNALLEVRLAATR